MALNVMLKIGKISKFDCIFKEIRAKFGKIVAENLT
jgi:hypothetical protein